MDSDLGNGGVASFERWRIVAGIVWAVVVNLIESAIILFVLHTASQRSDSLAVTILVLLYVTMTTTSSGQVYVAGELVMRQTQQFVRLASLLNDPKSDEYEEEFKDGQQALRRASRRFWIDATFKFVQWAVALWFLLTLP